MSTETRPAPSDAVSGSPERLSAGRIAIGAGATGTTRRVQNRMPTTITAEIAASMPSCRQRPAEVRAIDPAVPVRTLSRTDVMLSRSSAADWKRASAWCAIARAIKSSTGPAASGRRAAARGVRPVDTASASAIQSRA
jgi:hypothetical protein